MNLIRPHTYFLVAANKVNPPRPVAIFNTKVPNGSEFRLDYILVSYPVEVGTDPPGDLSGALAFTFGITDGLAYNNLPIQFRDMTTPAAGSTLRASWGLRIEVPPNAYLTMEVRQVGGLSNLVQWVSITYLGKKGWGRR